ncbi:uncharacterized protein EV154DRAFT_514521 [Mucor mucedo]|uniref:uncharacterized protein n=1 Tax=Mucor mucedo TaxID=29922 RepID=UPI0022201047|nr:uncharacterized protein EV154DRAFT_514521 [Mucor mucedo]KAI7889532.1 hypothetical protein EV154DRAFT_514521 [Mucor mucedo]
MLYTQIKLTFIMIVLICTTRLGVSQKSYVSKLQQTLYDSVTISPCLLAKHQIFLHPKSLLVSPKLSNVAFLLNFI